MVDRHCCCSKTLTPKPHSTNVQGCDSDGVMVGLSLVLFVSLGLVPAHFMQLLLILDFCRLTPYVRIYASVLFNNIIVSSKYVGKLRWRWVGGWWVGGWVNGWLLD